MRMWWLNKCVQTFVWSRVFHPESVFFYAIGRAWRMGLGSLCALQQIHTFFRAVSWTAVI